MEPRSTRAFGALLVLASLATALAPSPAGAAAGTIVPIDLADCAYTEVAVKVDPARTRALVPAPFAIRIHPVDGSSLILLGTVECATAASRGHAGTASFGYTSVALAPPADPALAGSGVTFWLYRLEHFLVAGDVYHTASAAAHAEVTFAAIDATVGAGLSSLSIAWDGKEHHGSIAGSAPVPADVGAPIHWREYHAVPGGITYLDATLVPGPGAANAPGVLTPAPGTIAHAVLGDANGGLGTYGPDYTFREAFMGFLPSP